MKAAQRGTTDTWNKQAERERKREREGIKQAEVAVNEG